MQDFALVAEKSQSDATASDTSVGTSDSAVSVELGFASRPDELGFAIGCARSAKALGEMKVSSVRLVLDAPDGEVGRNETEVMRRETYWLAEARAAKTASERLWALRGVDPTVKQSDIEAMERWARSFDVEAATEARAAEKARKVAYQQKLEADRAAARAARAELVAAAKASVPTAKASAPAAPADDDFHRAIVVRRIERSVEAKSFRIELARLEKLVGLR